MFIGRWIRTHGWSCCFSKRRRFGLGFGTFRSKFSSNGKGGSKLRQRAELRARIEHGRSKWRRCGRRGVKGDRAHNFRWQPIWERSGANAGVLTSRLRNWLGLIGAFLSSSGASPRRPSGAWASSANCGDGGDRPKDFTELSRVESTPMATGCLHAAVQQTCRRSRGAYRFHQLPLEIVGPAGHKHWRSEHWGGGDRRAAKRTRSPLGKSFS
mmetsp:Transcript_142451/g.262586  ORF Transcript_142451/g.262586 Transcript_142451/m.262586 type:complete len:212 (-) Transcript_142451:51-686(-)